MNALLLLLQLCPAAFSEEAKPKIAVVIDDFGLTYPKNVPDEEWMALKFPVTYAVMPESPVTKKAAQRATETGHEVIVHFPFDPFQKLILAKDAAAPEDVKSCEALLEKSFKQIPQHKGLNNHRSYKGTMNRPLMAYLTAERRDLDG